MKLKSTLLKYMIISLIALVCFSFFNNCEQNDSSVTWQINDLEYFEATGLNVLVFHNSYAVGKQAGIEIIQHGERVATNGYISLELPDGGEGELPAQAEAHRIVDQNNGSIKTRIAYPELEFNYLINIEAEGEALRLSVDLDQPLREEWRNNAIFKLEFYPSAFFGKTFQLGETSDIFPRQLNGPTVIDAEGNIRPTPLATGNKLIIAAEDPLLKMEIEQVEGELELIDGRYLNRHGWFFLQSRIPVGKTAGALEWIIKLNSVVGAHSILEAYGFNMHEWSYIPGGVISGTALVRPDLLELKEPFPYLWQQSEYVIGGAATYIFCVLAADKLLNG